MLIRLLLALVLLVPSMAGAATFWDDEMESGNSGFTLPGSGAMSYDTDVKFSGSGSVRYNFTSLCYPDASAQANCGGFMDRSVPNTTTLYTRFYLRLSAGFTVSDVFTKLLRTDTNGIVSNWWTLGCCGSRVLKVHDQNVPVGETTVQSTTFAAQDTTWYCIETQETLNTPGVANGIARAWVEGQLVMDKTNVPYRASGSTAVFNNIRLYRQTGLGYIWFDRLAAGNTRIGCVGAPPQVDTIAPTQVTGASATASSSSSILVAHAASTDAVGVTGYDYQRCTGAACTNFSTVATNNALTYTDTGLTASTLYRYRITAKDAAGNIGTASAIVEATTLSDTPTAIAYGSSTLSSDNQSASAVTFNVTTPSGNDRLMVACLMARDAVASDLSATAVTYNGLPLTKIRADDANWGGAAHARVEQWYLIAPPVGTASFNAQWANGTPADYGVAGVSVYTGVDQLSPVEANAGASGSSTTPSVSITTLTNHAAIVDCLDARDDTGPTVGAGQVQRIKNQFGVSEGTLDWMGSSTVIDKTPAGAETMDWTQVSASWITNAIALKPATTNVAPTITSATASATGAALTYGATTPSTIRVQVTGSVQSDVVLPAGAFSPVATEVYSDTFTRADGAAGSPWYTAGSPMGIVSNRIQPPAGAVGVFTYYYLNLNMTVGNDQRMSLTLPQWTSTNGHFVNLGVRLDEENTGNGYTCEMNNNSGTNYARIQRWDAYSPTDLNPEGSTVVTLTGNDTFTCDAIGSGIFMFHNGVLIKYAIDTTYSSGPSSVLIAIPAGGNGNDVAVDNVVISNLASPYTYTNAWAQGSANVCFTPIDAAGVENTATGAGQCASLSGVVNQDLTPPVISDGAPTTALAAGTTGITESVATDERARCKRSLTDTTYALMSDEMSTANGFTHTWAATGLANNTSYPVYVRCTDQYDSGVPFPANVNTSSYTFTYSVAAAGGDTTRPSDVSGVSASAASASEIDITFTAATDNTAVTGYEGYLCSDAVCTTAQLANPNWSIATSQRIIGLGPNTTYYLAVKAKDAAGNNSLNYSNVVAVTTLPTSDTVPPSTMTNLRQDGSYKNSVILTWDQGTDDRGSVSTIIEQSPSGCADWSTVVSQLAMSKLIVSLSPNTTYCFRGKFSDGTNLSTAWSETLQVTTGTTGLPRPRLTVPFSPSRSSSGTRLPRP